MNRNDAMILFNVFMTEKTLDRNLYPEDLVNRHILSKHNAKQKMEEYTSKNWLIQSNKQGANTYRISNIGIAEICAYRDIRCEISIHSVR